MDDNIDKLPGMRVRIQNLASSWDDDINMGWYVSLRYEAFTSAWFAGAAH